ncbi:MAG: site-specific DNA-methyltransferase [Sphaerochaetaceae bacterium]
MPELTWIGKEKVITHHQDVPYRVLEHKYGFSVEGGESEKETKSGNKIIHGDNLEALKSLLPEYEGKIKCIYIDPPYNTGNEKWVYNDNVNHPKIKKWLNEVVGTEGEDLTRHDKWLCMMYPRLKLLHKLLSEDGAIFISIDDMEINTLKIVMDEIYGRSNFIACLPTIMNLKGNQDQYGFAGTHEYTLVYVKQKNITVLNQFLVDDDNLEEWIVDDIGYFKQGANLKSTGINAPREKRPNLFFPIFIDSEDNVYVTEDNNPPKCFVGEITSIYPITNEKEMSWRWSKNKFKNESYNLIVNRNDNISIYKKQRPELGELPSKKPKTIFYKPEYSSGNGTSQIKNIFGEKKFDNPKPLELIMDLLIIGSNKDSIILDSFAGSGTTGHAVLNLNKLDGGNRKFILVEMEDYAQDITAERVKRVIKGYGEGNKKVEGTGGEFDYYELGERLFLEDNNLNEEVGQEKIREYIYYTETKEFLNRKRTKENYYLLDNYLNTGYYFYYEKDKLTVLSIDNLNIVTQKAEQYVIYADICLLDKEFMLKNNIIFKKIPRDIKRF